MSGLNSYTKQVFVTKATTGASEAIRCDNDVKTMVVTGITTGTVVFEGSPDGTVWQSMAAGITADGNQTVTNGFSFIRANVTVATSVSVNAWLVF